MSDIMGGMPPGPQPPTARPQPNAMNQNRSIMNPTDMAAMTQTGTVNPNMTVKDLIEKVFGVPIDAPVSALTEAIKRQGQNKTGIGKMGAMAQGAGPQMGQPTPPPMQNRMPQGRPSAVSQRPQQGLSELMR